MTNSSPQTVAILMPGDMGHAVGRVLSQNGLDIITALAGRSARTAGLAQAGGIRDAGTLADVAQAADLVLSILPPAQAVNQARGFVNAVSGLDRKPVYVDCNAVSPATAQSIADLMADAVVPFIDAGIIGMAPGKGTATRFYVSGPDTTAIESLNGMGIDVIPMGPVVGRASAIKMVYAGLTKGTWTLHTAVLMAAERLGVRQELTKEFAFSQKAALAGMERTVPRLPADAGRWIGEMEEIAATFDQAGVTSGFHDGAAEVFRVLEQTPFAEETRESMDPDRDLDEAIPVFAEYLDQQKK